MFYEGQWQRTAIRWAGMVVLGALGMGLFQLGSMLYADWRFLHQARLLSERPRPAATGSAETPK